MPLLRRLFGPRRPLRHFALLDAKGRCRALRQAAEPPAEAGWVEVGESRPSWLGAPLPAAASSYSTSNSSRLDGIRSTLGQAVCLTA